MKRLYFLLILLLCFSLKVSASHIVGGEIQLDHMDNDNYKLTLNLYYDVRNSSFIVENTEPLILLHVFSKRDNQLILEDLEVSLVTQNDVQYTNPSCINNGQLQTRKLAYEAFIRLSRDVYNDPEGYYVVWERCCRNNVINNIFDPGRVGMVFYMEFPPVVLDGEAFLNSTPDFRTPVGDYLCVDEEFTFDFGATDDDGDSLVYSLASPWVGNSTPNFPGNVDPDTKEGGIPAFGAPYDEVTWLNVNGFQFGEDRPLPTNIAADQLFRINPNNGLIRVTPSRTGLFVFAVRCEEFRDGRKIGEVRRDFQFFVLDCPANNDPSIAIQTNQLSTAQSGGIFLSNSDTLYVSQESNELCTNIWLKDADMLETLRLRLVGVNFQPRQSFFSVSQGVVNGPNDSLRVEFCWPECLFSEEGARGLEPYVMDLVVSDDRCPRSANDTIRLTVISVPIINTPPEVGSTVLQNAKADFDFTIEKIVGEPIEFDVFARDLVDNDPIDLVAVGRGFELSDLGMFFENKSGTGSLESFFSWNTDCQLITEESNQFIIDFISRDESTCENKSDTISVELVVSDIPFNDQDFLPNNAFSPNGDAWNERFTMDNLPEETCRYQFKSIEIYTRWGAKVFESFERDFAWDGSNLPKGVYFYRVNFLSKVYKGTVSLFR